MNGVLMELGFLQRVAAERTGEAFRERVLDTLVRIEHDGATACVSQCRFERLGEALAYVGMELQTINHD